MEGELTQNNRLPLIIDFIMSEMPDIVYLQEVTKESAEKIPQDLEEYDWLTEETSGRFKFRMMIGIKNGDIIKSSMIPFKFYYENDDKVWNVKFIMYAIVCIDETTFGLINVHSPMDVRVRKHIAIPLGNHVKLVTRLLLEVISIHLVMD